MRLSEAFKLVSVISERCFAYRVGPEGVVGLLPQCALQVKVLGVVCGLRPRVADVALGVQPLRHLHGVLGAHSFKGLRGGTKAVSYQ